MSSSKTCRVTIVGAGIIGLTTACTLLKEYASHKNNLKLTIISETFSPETTGDVSAGYWQPYGLEAINEQTRRWAGYAYNIFTSEYFSAKAARAGVIQMTSYGLYNYDGHSNNAENVAPPYADLVRHFRMLDQYEIGMFDHLKPTWGHVMTSVVVEVRKYLPQLQRFLEHDHRVQFIHRRVGSLTELKDTADVVINCSGLGSKELVGDEKMRPARGQVIRVYAPWIKSIYVLNDGESYIIPQSDSVVLGGTFTLNDSETETNENDTRTILRNCTQCLPALEGIQDLQVQVGLRPYRDGGIRLEHERTNDGIDVVHCYGHSGSGVTLSWGCAKDVVDIVKTLLPPAAQQEETNQDVPEHEQLWRLLPHTA